MYVSAHQEQFLTLFKVVVSMRVMSVVVTVAILRKVDPSNAPGLVSSSDLDHTIVWQTLQAAFHILSALVIASLALLLVCLHWSLIQPLPSACIKSMFQNAERLTPERKLRSMSVFVWTVRKGSSQLKGGPDIKAKP